MKLVSKITKKEKKFLKFLHDDICLEKDADGEIYLFEKDYYSPDNNLSYGTQKIILNNVFFEVYFTWVEWEHKRSWTKQELLDLEVVEW